MKFRALILWVACTALFAALAPASAMAQSYTLPCPQQTTYDDDVPTFDEIVGVPLGAGGTGSTPRNLTAKIYQYFDAMVAYTANHPRVKVIRKDYGQSVLGNELRFYVVSTPDNIDNLDAGRADGPFWEGIKDGRIAASEGLAQVRNRPAFGWITATPHGGEAAAAEAISRMLYELTARTDCWNLKRLKDMDHFLMPVRNPDGRDAPPGGVRTSAWAFDHNRDFGTQNQRENFLFLPLLKKYPGVFFIDAHQQNSGYFFPPNEDPVHHEVSKFSLDFIQNKIGPALQQKFNDQSTVYRNYNTYDLFVPEYGDSVPSLLSGAAGMTFEKGTSEVYGKQVYDHYLAIDETVNVTVRDKNTILRDWVAQWGEAVEQGQQCKLQPNTLVSPLTNALEAFEVPDVKVCGYFYKPDNHAGDAAELIRHMMRQGVRVYRFNNDVALNGVHEFGEADAPQTLPAGTLYMPMDQPTKHWIQAVLGEDPYQPVNFFYDVAQWSYSLQRGQTGNGFLTEKPLGVTMTEVTDPDWGSVPAATPTVYAFDTDSMRGLALVVDLLDAGATVYRGRDAFDAAGKHFETGAALVDAASVASAGIDLAALADKRQTPIAGLGSYPVARFEMEKPKIGIYTGGATEPNNPIRPAAGSPYPGHCGVGGNTTYCQALYTLTDKIGLPGEMVLPVNTGDLTGTNLTDQGFTALINPTSTIAAGPQATALQSFVNAGGTYVGQLNGGTTSARNAGITTLNNQTPALSPGLSTPGSFFTATFNTASPAAWGFDDGGFIYRASSGDPVYDPNTLAGNGGSIPQATAAVSYSDPLRSFGFAGNTDPDNGAVTDATLPGRLPGRPAVVDQPFGAGRAILIGFDSFFRAWREHDERLVLNGVLYPTSAAINPSGVQARSQAEPLAAGELPAVRSRPAASTTKVDSKVIIRVARKDGRKLRRAVKAARLPKRLRARSRYVVTRKTVTFVVRKARTRGNDHNRGIWVGKIITPLKKRGVQIVYGQF
jgi:Zinc carboxypeptidase